MLHANELKDDSVRGRHATEQGAGFRLGWRGWSVGAEAHIIRARRADVPRCAMTQQSVSLACAARHAYVWSGIVLRFILILTRESVGRVPLAKYKHVAQCFRYSAITYNPLLGSRR